jgi:carbon-monoxide dehydrogenase catalytic subunit
MDKVGVCGATIDTIMARNFARMVASGAPPIPTTA